MGPSTTRAHPAIRDAIVVGGGPAGAIAARCLGAAGLDVVLVDKSRFPRPKVCGDGIVHKAVHVAEGLGLADALLGVPHVACRQVTAVAPNGAERTFPLPADSSELPWAMVARRDAFDAILLDAARPFAEVREGVAATALLRDGDRIVGVRARETETGREEELGARVVIGAGGARGMLAKQLGVPKHDPRFLIAASRGYYTSVSDLGPGFEVYYHRALLPGYAWVFPLPGGRANVGLGVPVADLKRRGTTLPRLREQVLTDGGPLSRRVANAEPDEPWHGWMIPTASRPRRIAFDGALLVGDAAGLVDSFSGAGIGYAMRSAQLAARVLVEGFHSDAPILRSTRRYERLLWREILPDILQNRLLRRLARSPALVDALLARATKRSRLAHLASWAFHK